MTKYTEIKGRKVQTFSGDPPAPTEGQVWFNSSPPASFKVGSISPFKTSAIGFGGGTPNTTAGMVWNDTS